MGSALKLVREEYHLEPFQCGDGSYLESNPGHNILMFGYPGVGPVHSAELLRFSMGSELDLKEVATNLEQCLRNLKNSSTFSGDCQTKHTWKKCEFCHLTDLISRLKCQEFYQNRIFYQNDNLPGNSGSPILSSGDKVR